MAYEVMTWTEFSMGEHLGREGGMDDRIWQAIYYLESDAGMRPYIDAVLNR